MIINILKNGKVIKDLTGHVVKKTEVPEAYGLLKRRKNEKKN
jgi:hypothetical protein